VKRQVVGTHAPLFVYYEIYPGVNSEKLAIRARIVNEKGAIIRTFEYDRLPTKPITRHFFKIDLQEFAVGRYVVEMQVSDGIETTLKGVDFRIRIPGLPGTVDDIELAIRQLRYIANTGRLRDMLKAEPRHREDMFRNFWKERDPSPDTEMNELLLEYYGRIATANEMFGSVRDGWETDRGEVLVRFGMPDEIERHPYEIDSKPYEIWYYYDSQKRYIFIDEMGYGEYRLVSNLWQ
jgi:GWxTD domain-containing protein